MFYTFIYFWFCIQIDYLTHSNVPLTKLEAVGFTCDPPTALEGHVLERKLKRKNEKKRIEVKYRFRV